MKNLLNLEETIAKDLFNDVTYPYDVLPKLKDYILNKQKELDANEYEITDDIYIHKSVNVSDKATILGPTIIGANTQIRPNAYIRGSVIIGESCVIGNASEVKNSIIFNNSEVPHFNYVGDSILGYKSHLGAGVILANLKADGSNIVINSINTGLRKIGSILGDYANIGCNSVLNPGTIIGRNSIVYPLSNVRGIINDNMIYKDKDHIIKKD